MSCAICCITTPASTGRFSQPTRLFQFFAPEFDAILNRGVSSSWISYQPLVDLATNTVTGCEALLRRRHPQQGMIAPAEFIPVAEDTSLIIEIGEWVLKQACTEAVSWPNQLQVAVNVSSVQSRSKTLALTLAAALSKSGLAPGRLELEITETVLIRDEAEALAVLLQLQDLGVRIALNDFGAGYPP